MDELKKSTIVENFYINGDYMDKNPTWHVEHSLWKAKNIIKMINRNKIKPKTICEVGCGAGEILRQLQLSMNRECKFYGYEISPQALEMCKKRENDKLHFKLKNILREDVFFDLVLAIDLVEHLEDHFGFLKGIKPKSQYKIIHIPLDMTVFNVIFKRNIYRVRESFGHIHYFTKDTFIQILKELNYEVIDYFYTDHADLPTKSIKTKISRLVRKIFFQINKDLTVRTMQGYSLIVLVK